MGVRASARVWIWARLRGTRVRIMVRDTSARTRVGTGVESKRGGEGMSERMGTGELEDKSEGKGKQGNGLG